jgi:sulfite dehydrogenase
MSRRASAASVATIMALLASMSLAGAQPPAQPVPEDQAAPGPGRELFIAHCSSCHSVDYIRMHAPFGTRALWESSVAKMRNAFKAPVGDEDARAIVEYLSVAYGPESPAAKGPSSADDRQ